MELMSSLLLCVALAFPPLALAESTVRYAEYSPLRTIEYSEMERPLNFRPNSVLTNTLLGIRPSLLKKRIDLTSPFLDYTCKHCIDCMQRAIKDFKFKSQLINKRPGFEDIREEIIASYNEVPRDKRELDFKPDETTEKTKKSKSKKAKFNKTVTVTKYNVDKQITALKVKETQVAADQMDDTLAFTTCQVYSVKKSYPCDTPESDLILAAARRKVNKKSKKEKDKTKVASSTTTTKPIAPAFRKREVDNSQVPENFMPSIEELY